MHGIHDIYLLCFIAGGQVTHVGAYLYQVAERFEEIIAYLKSPAGSEFFKTETYLVSRLYFRAVSSYRRFRVKRTLRQVRNIL